MNRFFSTARLREGLSRFPNDFSAHPLLALDTIGLSLKIAIVVVTAILLKAVGVAPVVIIGVLGIGLLIAIAARRSAKQKTEVIFTFYVSADEVLRDDKRRRYRFEIADVIGAGEKIVCSMPDPPPLSRFALGALYSLISEHNAVVEHLGIAAEEEVLRESIHASPSRQLRRYVKRLRQIERTPERAPKVYAAIKSLEQMHQLRAARMLAESQQFLKRLVEEYEQTSGSRENAPIFIERSLRSLAPPPPISELLNDIYPEEQTS